MPKRPTIAVLGASVRGAATAWSRAGYRVQAADLFADADLQRQCAATQVTDYPCGLADWLARMPCDGWMYTGALENYPELVDEMANSRLLLGNSGAVLRRVRDPLALQEALRRAHFRFPETRLAGNGRLPPGHWLAKTYRGSNGSGVALATSRERTGYWQQLVAGEAGSAIYVGSSGECVLLGVTRQLVGEAWAGASEFQYCGSIAPWPLTATLLEQLETVGKLLVDQFALRGLFGLDFLLAGNDVWPLEVNPRWTAAVEVLQRATANVIGLHIAAFTEVSEGTIASPITPQSTRSRTAGFKGKAVLYAKKPLVISSTRSEWLLEQGGTSSAPTIADIPVGGATIQARHPILTLFAAGTSVKHTVDALRERVARLESVLYRGDET